MTSRANRSSLNVNLLTLSVDCNTSQPFKQGNNDHCECSYHIQRQSMTVRGEQLSEVAIQVERLQVNTKLVDSDGNAVDEVNLPSDDLKKSTENVNDDAGVIKNNFINQFLLNTRCGFIVNISLCLALSIVLATLPNVFDSVYETIFKPQVIGLVLSVDGLMLTTSVIVVYYPSRLSSSTSFSWFIGTLGFIFIACFALFDFQATHLTSVGRVILGEELIRITMKIVAYLYECNKSDQVYKDSTVGSFIYFLFAPTLQYKAKYPLVQQPIRWHLVFVNCCWFVIVLTLYFRWFDTFIYPLCKMDMATVTLSHFALTTLYIVIFSTLTYMIIVTFFFFAIWNETFAELLSYPDRRFFGEPRDFLRGTKIVRAINIVVSNFLYFYVYKPFYSMTQSRLFSLCMVFFISVAFHEVVESYALMQLLLPNFLYFIIIPLLLVKRTTYPPLQIIRTVIVIIGLCCYMYTHILEYIAWQSPSVDLTKESKLRFIPLSFTFMARIFSAS